MKINTKYEMGQKVYRVVERFRRIENVQTCDICYGKSIMRRLMIVGGIK